MKTTLHRYYFDLDKPAEKEAYQALTAQLNVSHAGKFFNVLADTKREFKASNTTETVELDTSCLFENQWNEEGAEGRRLFDWYEAIYYNNGRKNERIKGGHWLELTPEMEHARTHTLQCGYCGKYVREGEPRKWHCEKCIGSEHLKETEIGLLRLRPVADKDRSFDLTDEEKTELVPLYKVAQGLGQITRDQEKASRNRRRIAELIPEAEKKAAELIENARIETKAQTWLMDNGLNLLGNCIYYSHTKRFGFGWRTPLTAEEKSKLLDVISEFPFDYDLK